jgi:hypothetical protein
MATLIGLFALTNKLPPLLIILLPDGLSMVFLRELS